MKSDKKIWLEGHKEQKQMIITIKREQTDYKHCTSIKQHNTFKMTAGGNMLPSARHAKTIVA